MLRDLLLWFYLFATGKCKQEDLPVISSYPKFAFWTLADWNVIKHSNTLWIFPREFDLFYCLCYVGWYILTSQSSSSHLFCIVHFILYIQSRNWFGEIMARFLGRMQLQNNLSQSKLAKAILTSLTFLFSSSADSYSFLVLTRTLEQLQGETGQVATTL